MCGPGGVLANVGPENIWTAQSDCAVGELLMKESSS